MSECQQIIEVLQLAVERGKPQGTELLFHPIVTEQPDARPFTTVHVVTADGRPVDASFDFHAVAKALGTKARAKIEDRKIYGQEEPVPYKVVSGTAGEWPFEILFLMNPPV